MAYYKAIIDFSKVPDGGLLAPANLIYTLMLFNALTFPGVPVTMINFLADIDAFETAMSKAVQGGTDRTTIKDNCRAKLEEDLGLLGGYVNVVAKGDKAIIDLSGFESYSTEHSRIDGVTFVPSNVHWDTGILSGTANLRWTGDGKGSTYEVNTCTGDPTVEANWTYRGSFTGGKATLSGFTPGAIIWGRVRKIGTGGDVGGWSDPAQTRVM